MKLHHTVSTALILSTLSYAATIGKRSDDLLVETSSGKIEGYVNSTYPDVRQFLGIPYAKPPVGDLRFAPPKRYNATYKHVPAKTTPYACPQTATGPGGPQSIWTYSTPQFLNSAPVSEHCLSLSVYAPAKCANDTEDLPVIIWLHGGGLTTGSSSVEYQVPPAWIQRSQRHIVVSVQYRLNIFGFPNAAGLSENNLGLLDQRAAIEWVRDNIHAFGGDITKSVLWGQSAGAAAADFQNFAYPDDPIVSGFIQGSGTALFPEGAAVTHDPSHSNFTYVATQLGCSTSPSEQLACMRKVSMSSIVAVMTNYTKQMTPSTPPLLFIGVADEKLIFANYTERYAMKALSDRPAIIGSNTMEGNLMVPFPKDPHNGSTINTTLAEKETLFFFQCPAANTAGMRAAAGRKTFRYLYAGNFSDVSPLDFEGAYHATELPQVFGTRGDFRPGLSEFERQTSNVMQDLWLSFAENAGEAESNGWQEALTGGMLLFGQEGMLGAQVVNETLADDPCKKAGLGM